MEYHERMVPGTANWRQTIAEHMLRYRFASQFVTGMRVLDAGCGVGYGSQILLQAGAREVVGVDVSAEAMEIARKEFCRPGIRFVQGDCQFLDTVQGEFDAVVALESLEHLQQPRNFLERARDLLRSSGILICSTPNGRVTRPVNGKPRNPYHVFEYTLEEFRNLLQEFFGDALMTGQHHTAAYVEAMHLARVQSNPAVRMGRLLQRLGGRMWASGPLWPGGAAPTEGDYVISEANVEEAFVLLAVCRSPRKKGARF